MQGIQVGQGFQAAQERHEKAARSYHDKRHTVSSHGAYVSQAVCMNCMNSLWSTSRQCCSDLVNETLSAARTSYVESVAIFAHLAVYLVGAARAV
ncbi:hypothetical protein NDU88_001645 [Pleurodeles waltl]|uniref:Uncharacterized protein n=1 Tax=Pleurodeles waltl TaxID=8319 RepID=A0AAV7V8X5_PLEWA|nr:hypothetical protein NDU88_001645 [Pleurodeles waltl]